MRVHYPESMKKVVGRGTPIAWMIDASAHTIANMMRFAPAKNGNVPVDVGIEVPINFASDQ